MPVHLTGGHWSQPGKSRLLSCQDVQVCRIENLSVVWKRMLLLCLIQAGDIA
jgi:hypothetical protein